MLCYIVLEFFWWKSLKLIVQLLLKEYDMISYSNNILYYIVFSKIIAICVFKS